MNMDLTQEEAEIIQAHRRQRLEAKKQQSVHLLRVAADYARWLQEEGAGSTYSTFCDDFGYEAVEGEDRPQLYSQVTGLVACAYGLVSGEKVQND